MILVLPHFINNQIKPTFDDIKNKINNDLIPAFQGIVNAVKPLVDKYLASLKQILGQIGQAIQNFAPYFDTLKKDFQKVGEMLKPFLPLLQTLASYWWIVLIPLAAVVTEMGLFVLGIGALVVILANFARGVTGFITGVVQVFSGFIQQVSGYLQALDDLIHGRFDKIGKDMKLSSDGFKLTWSGAWNVIQGIWYAGFGGIIAGAQWFVTTIFNLFVDLYNSLVGHSIIPDMVNGIINWFGTMVTRGVAKAGDLVSGVTGKLGQLLSIAYNAGLSVATGIANGITAGIGGAIGAAQNLAAQVASFLPHSPAKQGPLRDLNKFGPALVGGFSEGIIKSVPTMQHAMNLMLAPTQMSPSGISHIAPSSMRGGSSGGTTIFNVNVTLEHVNEFGTNMPEQIGRKIGQVAIKEMSRQYRSQWNNASGGVT